MESEEREEGCEGSEYCELEKLWVAMSCGCGGGLCGCWWFCSRWWSGFGAVWLRDRGTWPASSMSGREANTRLYRMGDLAGGEALEGACADCLVAGWFCRTQAEEK